MITPEQLRELSTLEDAATPAPWQPLSGKLSRADSLLCVAMRNALPDLLDIAMEHLALKSALEVEMDAWDKYVGGGK